MELKQILILVGFAIYYFIRANSKKDQDQKAQPKKRPQQRANPTPQRSIEDILRDLAGDTPPVTRQKEIYAEPEQEIVELPTEQKPRRPHVEPVTHKKIEVEHDDEGVDFDLRQAIIIDAILNRPHQ